MTNPGHKIQFSKDTNVCYQKKPIHRLSNIIINKYVSKRAAAQVRTTGFIVYMSQKISEKLHFLCKIYKDTAGVESSTIIYIERILVLCVIDKNTNWINGFEHMSCVQCRYMCAPIFWRKRHKINENRASLVNSPRFCD